MFQALSLTDTMIIIWAAVFVLAGFIEATTMDLTSIWFSGGALISLLIAIIFPNSLVAQFLAFTIVSALMLIFLRPIFKRYLKKNEVRTNADRLIGKNAYCIKAISPDNRGEVKIDGKIWTAVANEEININEKVEVLAIDGVKLVVKKL
ncbi:MAG: NfeD family protein [Tenericutes bacterium HGW-Tenericutes-1]|jgi:membrane protein implicated in regulation of membrane protease activity|nr:MAG: NfeD family protein [Tenericutes bacterium HGW-Tenericutes-1]